MITVDAPVLRVYRSWPSRSYSRQMGAQPALWPGSVARSVLLATIAVATTAGDAWASAAVGEPWSIGRPAPVLLALARLAPLALGMLLLARRPGAVVGRALVAAGVLLCAIEAVRIGAVLSVELGSPAVAPVGRLLADTAQILFVPIYAWPSAVVVLYPDGPATRAARVCLGILIGSAVVMSLSALFSAPVTAGPYAGAPNPWFRPVVEPFAEGAFAVGWVALASALVAVAVSAVRHSRSATGQNRRERLWLLPAATLPPVSLVACLFAIAGRIPMVAVDLAVASAQLAVVGAVLLAVVRHQLYGIDRLIGPAVVYSGLVIVLLVVYAGVSAAIGLFIGSGSPWATAIATAAAAALFLPVRARWSAAVERRLAPERVDAVTAVRHLGLRLHEGRAVPEDIGPLLARLLGDPGLVVQLTDPSGDDRGRPSVHHTVVAYAGTPVAVLRHAAPVDPALLAAVTAEAAPLLAIARLQEDLRSHLRRTRESRDRVVRSATRDRRMLERDLHDGVQQRLVALGILLRRLQHRTRVLGAGHERGPERPSEPGGASLSWGTTGSDPDDAGAMIDQAVDQVTATVLELRALAAGVRPPRLEDGLRAALGDLALDCPVRTLIHVGADRLPQDRETAAYLIVCEAVTNAVKHGHPARIVIDGDVQQGRLHLSITDDGCGGAQPRSGGGGLAGMIDRADAYGGRLTVRSESGSGTRIDLEMPCAS